MSDVAIMLLTAFGYVAVCYALPKRIRDRHRNDPTHIYARAVNVAVYTILVLCLSYWALDPGKDWAHVFGLHRPSLAQVVCILAAMVSLWAGHIYTAWFYAPVKNVSGVVRHVVHEATQHMAQPAQLVRDLVVVRAAPRGHASASSAHGRSQHHATSYAATCTCCFHRRH